MWLSARFLKERVAEVERISGSGHFIYGEHQAQKTAEPHDEGILLYFGGHLRCASNLALRAWRFSGHPDWRFNLRSDWRGQHQWHPGGQMGISFHRHWPLRHRDPIMVRWMARR